MQMKLDSLSYKFGEQINNPLFIDTIKDILSQDQYGLLNLRVKRTLNKKSKRYQLQIDKMIEVNQAAKTKTDELKKKLLALKASNETELEKLKDIIYAG
jgi:hypothetical protein